MALAITSATKIGRKAEYEILAGDVRREGRQAVADAVVVAET
jgi:hypothetical protein